MNNARDGIGVGKRSPAGGSLPLPDGRNNILVGNFANPNGNLDHWDSNPACDANIWSNPPPVIAWRLAFIFPGCAT